MSPPAFQFYADDFIGGTVDLSAEEVGAYIRLLCFQWGRGKAPVSKEAIDRVAGCAVTAAVVAKFPDGKNPRLESERVKQMEYRAKQAVNGAKGGRPMKRLGLGLGYSGETQTKAKKSSPSPSPSPVLAEREYLEVEKPLTLPERHFPEANGRMTLQEVKDTASMIGLAEWKAVDWFNEMEGCGWLDHNRRPIHNGRAVLARVKTKWEADGRPSGPPKGQNANNQKPRGGSPDRNAGTYNEGRAHLYKNAAVRGTRPIPDVPNV